MLTVMNPDARLVHLKGIYEPYCERFSHAPGDLTTVEPRYFGSLCGWLRGTRQRAASEDQRHDAEAHVLIDASEPAGRDGDTVSSRTSRRTVSRGSSSSSTIPPGKTHSPLSARLMAAIRPSSRMTAAPALTE
jgi:hypothetical protein